MRFNIFHLVIALTTTLPTTTFAQRESFISASPLPPSTLARALISRLPNPSVGLLAPPYYWWQSGSVLDALLNYYHTTKDPSYNDLISNTLISQVTGTNDFMTPDATGNDDQAWWGLAAMSAAEYGLPPAQGGLPWINYAQNVFERQKGRWNTARCGGGLKWKIREGDPGYTYRSTISNGLFFQLAARLARFTPGDGDARFWAERAYDWTVGVGLIDGQFNVFDGTDDSKGTGCIDVNHLQWSYNTGVYMYGAAVMADVTKDPKWLNRTRGLLSAARRLFVLDGRLYEQACERPNNCNTDQVSFKGTLARWMGASAVLLPSIRPQVVEVMGGAVDSLARGWTQGADVMLHFSLLEAADALIGAGGGVVSGFTVERPSRRFLRFMR